MAPVISQTSSLLLFGPQQTQVSGNDLSRIRSTINGTPDLAFLQDTIEDLKSFWPTIVAACPQLREAPGDQRLEQLHKIINTDEHVDIKELSAGNILTDTLTVVSHVVEFWHLATTKVQTDLFSCASGEASSRLEDAQGFCIGFLTAAAVAASKTKAEFERHVAAALRLAVCIGAMVELGESTNGAHEDRTASISVGWKSESQYEALKKTLDSQFQVCALYPVFIMTSDSPG